MKGDLFSYLVQTNYSPSPSVLFNLLLYAFRCFPQGVNCWVGPKGHRRRSSNETDIYPRALLDARREAPLRYEAPSASCLKPKGLEAWRLNDLPAMILLSLDFV